MVDTATVRIWGMDVGVISWLAEHEYAVFEYYPEFLRQGLDIAPIKMSLNAALNGSFIFQFPALRRDSFSGLPGLLADSLPDKFGNAISLKQPARVFDAVMDAVRSWQTFATQANLPTDITLNIARHHYL